MPISLITFTRSVGLTTPGSYSTYATSVTGLTKARITPGMRSSLSSTVQRAAAADTELRDQERHALSHRFYPGGLGQSTFALGMPASSRLALILLAESEPRLRQG